MVRTAIQLYTLRGLDAPPWEIVSRVGDTAFEGVELYDAHFDELDDDGALGRTVESLDDAGLEVVSAHAGIDRLESATGEVVDVCESLDCSRLVVPSYDSDAFTTRGGVDDAADRIADVAAELADEDIELLYHNHGFEFAEVDGDVAFESFVDRADGRFGFEPDVGLARHVEYDSLDLLELVAGRAPLVHLTDTVPGDSDRLHADIGEGVVDAGECAIEAGQNGAEWLICENGLTDDAARSLERGSEAFLELRRLANEGSPAR